MDIQITLGLITLFFTKALALKCYEYYGPVPNEYSYTNPCPDRCGSVTASLSTNGIQVDYSIHTCIPPTLCISGRVNVGLLKLTANSKCCDTDQCNKQVVPALPNQPPNGKKCCNTRDCSDTVNCEGDEDHCFSATVVLYSVNATVSGCATKSVCEGLLPLMHTTNVITDVKCCEGDLCNSTGSLH
ncbi:urokinase plasminogen activator surface receptor-like [Electrophorus electricus]|uniref:urokinase plasminogen activator surface receptor-like n=1 Tax=Electrophorus electricus TaxID=8005 RepID=UPI0015D09EBA|nr:urokinase plasminogen activator surface receptor-like [Electrophorus electricus]